MNGKVINTHLTVKQANVFHWGTTRCTTLWGIPVRSVSNSSSAPPYSAFQSSVMYRMKAICKGKRITTSYGAAYADCNVCRDLSIDSIAHSPFVESDCRKNTHWL